MKNGDEVTTTAQATIYGKELVSIGDVPAGTKFTLMGSSTYAGYSGVSVGSDCSLYDAVRKSWPGGSSLAFVATSLLQGAETKLPVQQRMDELGIKPRTRFK